MQKSKRILAILMAAVLLVLALTGKRIGVRAEEKDDEGLVSKYYGPADGVEIPELREEYGKHFRLPDGTFQYIGSTLRQHYLDDFGSFQNIDNTIVEENDTIGDTVYSYVNKDSDIICRFTDSSNSGPYSVHIQYNSCSIGSGLLGTRYQKIDLEDIEALDLLDGFIEPEKTILYSTEDGYYILYYVTPDAVKEYIIINSPDSNEFHFQLANCATDRTVLRSKTDAERSERTL